MSTHINGKPIRERGGSRFRPSRKPQAETHNTSVTALVVESGIYNDNLIAESVTTDILGATSALGQPIHRRSKTEREHLKIFPADLEFERLKDTIRTQTTKDGKQVITSDPCYRVAWKSDRNLLRTNKPDDLRGIKFKRTTSHTKLTRTEVERPAEEFDPVPQPPELD